MEQDFEVTRAIRDLVISVENYRLLAARSAFGMGATEMIALSHLFVERTCTPTELAARLKITTPSVTELVDRLERAGLAVRRPHPHDRRKVAVGLTEQAEETVGSLFGRIGEATTRCTSTLDPRERHLVLGFLRDVTDAYAATQPVVERHRATS